MTPVSFSPITAGAVGAYNPTAGNVASPVNGAEFASKLGSVQDGALSIPLTGGVNPAQQTVMPQMVNEPTNWGHMAQQMVRDVNEKQQVAGHLVRDVLAGGPTPVHEALIASEEASVSFQVLTEMRNKMLEAYQEVMRMQV